MHNEQRGREMKWQKDFCLSILWINISKHIFYSCRTSAMVIKNNGIFVFILLCNIGNKQPGEYLVFQC